MSRAILLLSSLLLLMLTGIVSATNESSYKYGYNVGFGTYKCLSEDTRYLAGTCDGFPGSNDINTDCVSLAGGQDTNSTACMDGVIQGWSHWCTQYTKECVKNEIPKPNYNQTGFVNQTTSESSYNEGLKFGHDEYQKCNVTCLNLDALGLDCQTSPYVDNVTACNEGYTKAWIHEGGQTSVATCIISGHTWDAGSCQSGRLVGITGPGHCYNTKEGERCDSGGWTRIH
jgi:hypothetical protein